MEQYFYVEDGNQKGPFTIEELTEKNLSLNTLVWKEGMANWQKISEVPVLANIFAVVTPPPIPILNPPPVPIDPVPETDVVSLPFIDNYTTNSPFVNGNPVEEKPFDVFYEDEDKEEDNYDVEYELASPGSRLLASIIDGFVSLGLLIVPIIGIVFYLVYTFAKDALPFLDGQSLGKKAMGIRVVDAKHYRPITGDYGKALIRTLSLAIPFFGIVDACRVLGDESKRFGDKWADTTVVRDYSKK
ncbi:MAG: GYF domain-containing protein [Chitinophagales bacterium]